MFATFFLAKKRVIGVPILGKFVSHRLSSYFITSELAVILFKCGKAFNNLHK